MTMTLHCFGESGNAYKAALTLELSGAEWTPAYVDFFNGGVRTPEFLDLNVMGEVPVLEDGDMVLTQSGVIQDYISSKTVVNPLPSAATCYAGCFLTITKSQA
jgi:glutathione S-transferase